MLNNATQFIEQAEKIHANSTKWTTKFISLFVDYPINHNEEAGELYMKAANIYAMNLHPALALECYQKAYELFLVGNCHLYARNSAVKCAELTTENSAKINWYVLAITCAALMTDSESFVKRTYESIAVLYERDELCLEAIEWWKKITPQTSTNCTKIAELYVQINDYAKASEYYESAAMLCLEKSASKYNAKSNFFMALLCQLALGDNVRYTQCLSQYEALDYTFPNSLDHLFVTKIANCNDVEQFADLCFERDKTITLTPIQVKLLTQIKTYCVGGNETQYDENAEGDLT